MAAHGLVHVHGVQARRVKAGQPHVAHDHHCAAGQCSVSEPLGQGLTPGLVADVRLPFQRVGCRAGHYDLDGTLHVVLAMPVGAQAYQFAVEVNADAPAHADYHRLAV